jgi:hypothetical protein
VFILILSFLIIIIVLQNISSKLFAQNYVGHHMHTPKILLGVFRVESIAISNEELEQYEDEFEQD